TKQYTTYKLLIITASEVILRQMDKKINMNREDFEEIIRMGDYKEESL
ncbi:MAG: hypothetical protein ACI8Q2_000510, partial [Candidatus Omnitrophota bacterium]